MKVKMYLTVYAKYMESLSLFPNLFGVIYEHAPCHTHSSCSFQEPEQQAVNPVAALAQLVPDVALPALPTRLGDGLGPYHGGLAKTNENTEGFHQGLKICEGTAQVVAQGLMASEQAIPGVALGNLVRAIGSARRVLQMRYIVGSASSAKEHAKSLNSGFDAYGKDITDRTALTLDLLDNTVYAAYGVLDTVVWLTEVRAFSLGEAAVAVGTANNIVFAVAVAGEIALDGYQMHKQADLEGRLQAAIAQIDAALADQRLADQENPQVAAAIERLAASREHYGTALKRIHKDRLMLGFNIFRNLLLIAAVIAGVAKYRNKVYFGVLTGVTGVMGFHRIWTDSTLSSVRKRHAAAEEMLQRAAPAA